MQVQLSRDKRGQVVPIPAEFELPETTALMHREGSRLVIKPMPKQGLLDLLRSLEPLAPEDAFPDNIDETLLPLPIGQT
jgi:antitoxin VapB